MEYASVKDLFPISIQLPKKIFPQGASNPPEGFREELLRRAYSDLIKG